MEKSDKKQILIVEDDPDGAKLLEKILNHSGYATHIYDEGNKTLEFCKTTKVDLIFMDISLQGMDGLTLTTHIRKLPEYKEVPIIAITAHVMNEMREKAKDSGCTDFITKPVMPQGILEITNKYLK